MLNNLKNEKTIVAPKRDRVLERQWKLNKLQNFFGCYFGENFLSGPPL